jgi:hypothetical protein
LGVGLMMHAVFLPLDFVDLVCLYYTYAASYILPNSPNFTSHRVV